MWLERFMLIVTSLYEDFLPSAWGMFWPTVWDILFLIGSIGLFFFMFLLFTRLMPMLSMFELRKLAASTQRKEARP
jgi:molybdopterin-containing oxidoreductase family membrane subunit